MHTYNTWYSVKGVNVAVILTVNPAKTGKASNLNLRTPAINLKYFNEVIK